MSPVGLTRVLTPSRPSPNSVCGLDERLYFISEVRFNSLCMCPYSFGRRELERALTHLTDAWVQGRRKVELSRNLHSMSLFAKGYHHLVRYCSHTIRFDSLHKEIHSLFQEMYYSLSFDRMVDLDIVNTTTLISHAFETRQ